MVDVTHERAAMTGSMKHDGEVRATLAVVTAVRELRETIADIAESCEPLIEKIASPPPTAPRPRPVVHPRLVLAGDAWINPDHITALLVDGPGLVVFEMVGGQKLRASGDVDLIADEINNLYRRPS